jgi:hypothetical protein
MKLLKPYPNSSIQLPHYRIIALPHFHRPPKNVVNLATRSRSRKWKDFENVINLAKRSREGNWRDVKNLSKCDQFCSLSHIPF